MTDTGSQKSLFILAICVPLAVVLGYLMSTPLSFGSYILVGGFLFLLLTPLTLRSHHMLAIVSWNIFLIVFFLPGQPSLGIVMAFLSLGMAVLRRTVSRSYRFLWVPQISLPLIILGIVVVITIELTGGFGGRALGSEIWGAKRYVGVLGAIAGYFALTSQSVDRKKGNLYVYLFLLSGVTAAISDLAYAAGPSFFFLYRFFPVEVAASQIVSQSNLMRLTGVTWGCMAMIYFLMARYGIKGLLDITKPWRLLVVFGILCLSLVGGYRTTPVLLAILFAVQFVMEGLMRSRYLPILGFTALLTGVFLMTFIDRLPLSVQRSLSFLPLTIDASARQDARGTLDWRLEIWKIVSKDIPKYLLLGKGYGFSGTDFYLTQEAVRRGMLNASYEDTLVMGNYHNGILTCIIPFGIFGFMAFLWFAFSATRVLHKNFRYSPPHLRGVNTFLFSFFLARLIFYLIFYGQFDSDLMVFAGVVGLSVSLNGGVCQRPALPLPAASA